MKLTLGTLAVAALALSACADEPRGPDPRSSNAPGAMQGRAGADVPTTRNTPGASPMNDSNSAGAPGGPGTGSVTAPGGPSNNMRR